MLHQTCMLRKLHTNARRISFTGGKSQELRSLQDFDVVWPGHQHRRTCRLTANSSPYFLKPRSPGASRQTAAPEVSDKVGGTRINVLSDFHSGAAGLPGRRLCGTGCFMLPAHACAAAMCTRVSYRDWEPACQNRPTRILPKFSSPTRASETLEPANCRLPATWNAGRLHGSAMKPDCPARMVTGSPVLPQSGPGFRQG